MLAHIAVGRASVPDRDGRRWLAFDVADRGRLDRQCWFALRRADTDQHLEIIDHLDGRLPFGQLDWQLVERDVIMMTGGGRGIAEPLHAETLGLARRDQRGRRRDEQIVGRGLARRETGGSGVERDHDGLHGERFVTAIVDRDVGHDVTARGLEVEHHGRNGRGASL